MDFDLSPEQQAFRESVTRWVAAEAPKSWARDLERDEHNYPFALWDKLTDAGFHGIGIDEQYGGQGGDVFTQMILARALARTLGGLAWIWGITSFAGGKSIGIYGTREQKELFLPQIAAGKLRAAIAFTEPGGGTDVLGALRTEAVRGDGGWIINGEKIWSSSAHVADYILLLARTDKNVAKRHQGVTLFWIPTKSPGVKITPLPKLGMRAMGSCAVHLRECVRPGFIGAGAAGECLVHAAADAQQRENHGGLVLPGCHRRRVGRRPGVHEATQGLRQTHRRVSVATTLCGRHRHVAPVHRADAALHGAPAVTERALSPGGHHAKVMASEHAVQAADLGIQILGGMGYSAETDMQRYWRDARLWRIGPITNEMARNVSPKDWGCRARSECHSPGRNYESAAVGTS